MGKAFEREVHCVLGLPFDALDLGGAVASVRDAVARRERCFLSTPNLNWVVACLKDDALRNTVLESDLSLADGMPIVWVARLLGIPIRERVAGSSAFEALRLGSGTSVSVYFFGGPPGVAEVACQRLNAAPSALTCAGWDQAGSGTVEEMSSDATIARINESGAQFVVVALGAKKGQAWIARNLDRLNAPLISHLGAVVNFVAGTVARAPHWVQRSGLEWLWRIKEERTLWRRYFSDGVVFIRVLFSRVLPLTWINLLRRPAQRNLDAAGIESHDGSEWVEIRLRGVWAISNLRPLREALAHVSLPGRNVRVDLGGVTYVDSAFIGLLMIFSGNRTRNGARLKISGARGAVRRIFRYSCAEHLLDRDAGEPGERSARGVG